MFPVLLVVARVLPELENYRLPLTESPDLLMALLVRRVVLPLPAPRARGKVDVLAARTLPMLATVTRSLFAAPDATPNGMPVSLATLLLRIPPNVTLLCPIRLCMAGVLLSGLMKADMNLDDAPEATRRRRMASLSRRHLVGVPALRTAIALRGNAHCFLAPRQKELLLMKHPLGLAPVSTKDAQLPLPAPRI